MICSTFNQIFVVEVVISSNLTKALQYLTIHPRSTHRSGFLQKTPLLQPYRTSHSQQPALHGDVFAIAQPCFTCSDRFLIKAFLICRCMLFHILTRSIFFFLLSHPCRITCIACPRSSFGSEYCPTSRADSSSLCTAFGAKLRAIQSLKHLVTDQALFLHDAAPSVISSSSRKSKSVGALSFASSALRYPTPSRK